MNTAWEQYDNKSMGHRSVCSVEKRKKKSGDGNGLGICLEWKIAVIVLQHWHENPKGEGEWDVQEIHGEGLWAELGKLGTMLKELPETGGAGRSALQPYGSEGPKIGEVRSLVKNSALSSLQSNKRFPKVTYINKRFWCGNWVCVGLTLSSPIRERGHKVLVVRVKNLTMSYRGPSCLKEISRERYSM